MPTVTLDIPLELVQSISAEALASNRGFEEVIVSTLSAALDPSPSAPTNHEKELAMAVERCRALEAGSLFSLNADHTGSRRLFSREEWRAMTANPNFRPTVFGRSFGKAVTDKLATAHTKTPDNKQIYKRL